MVKSISYIVTEGGITAVIDGESYTVTSDNPVYSQVKDAIINREDRETIANLFRTANAVKRYSKGNIQVQNGSLYFGGEEIHNVVVDRIFAFMAEGLPVEPLIEFLKRLLANPSRRSVDQLYKFLEHKNLPITEDGFFLAYKGVNDDYTDCHTGTFDNTPGRVNAMERNKVDDDFRAGCSSGFHAGSLEYSTSFGRRTVIVKIDPADVVSVPEDCNCQKLRTCKYEVVQDYDGPLPAVAANSHAPYEDTDWAGRPAGVTGATGHPIGMTGATGRGPY